MFASMFLCVAIAASEGARTAVDLAEPAAETHEVQAVLPGSDFGVEHPVVLTFADQSEFLDWARESDYWDDVRALEAKRAELQREYEQHGADARAHFMTELREARSSALIGFLYEDTYAKGKKIPQINYPNLGWVKWKNRVSSTDTIGTMVLFDRTFYRGPSRWIFTPIANLAWIAFDNRAESVLSLV